MREISVEVFPNPDKDILTNLESIPRSHKTEFQRLCS